jgi:hypothetical protein
MDGVELEEAAWVIHQMRALLDSDQWEEQKADTIYAYHQGLSDDMQFAVWDLLKDEPGTRKAWKEYVSQGWHKEHGRRRG